MITWKEWLEKKKSDNVNWGEKIPRDIQLTNKVMKPTHQPQVKESKK